MDRRSIETGPFPQLSGDGDRIKLHRFPPCRFVATAMENTMVCAAKGNCELVADPAAQRTWLGKSQMVGIRRSSSADETRLRRDELKMRAIAIAARFAVCKGAFVDMPGDRVVHPLYSVRGCRNWLDRFWRQRHGQCTPARPSFARAHFTGRFARRRRFLWSAGLNAGPERSQ
jgi:hypothetical protein